MTLHDVLGWLKAHKLASSRASLYRLIDHEGFPRPVLSGRKGAWSRDQVEAWWQSREDRAWAARYTVDNIVAEARFRESADALSVLDDPTHRPRHWTAYVALWARLKAGEDDQVYRGLIGAVARSLPPQSAVRLAQASLKLG